MPLCKAIWDNTYGLLVDDGRLALGTLAGLAATGVLSALAPQATVQAYAGPVLLAGRISWSSATSMPWVVTPYASWRARLRTQAPVRLGRQHATLGDQGQSSLTSFANDHTRRILFRYHGTPREWSGDRPVQRRARGDIAPPTSLAWRYSAWRPTRRDGIPAPVDTCRHCLPVWSVQ